MKLVIVAARGPALIQDGGRPGRMHEGVPPGGALVPELLAAANVALGNAPGAPAIEHYGRLEIACDAPLVAATDGELVELGSAVLTPRARAGYLAVPGGLDAPVARVGAVRLLRAGDALAVRGNLSPPRPPSPPRWSDDAIAVLPGPDPGDVATLLASTFRISPVGDRVGVRLAGPPVHAPAVGASAPMVRGAIQATPSGELVVLGPDHPTTGGYPVIAVVAEADIGRLLALRPGATLRFRPLLAMAPQG